MPSSNFYAFCSVSTILLLGGAIRFIKLSGRTITVSATCTDVRTRTHAQSYRKVRYYRPLYTYSLDGVQMTGSPLYFSRHYHLNVGDTYEIKVLKRKPTQVFTVQDVWYAVTPVLFALVMSALSMRSMTMMYYMTQTK